MEEPELEVEPELPAEEPESEVEPELPVEDPEPEVEPGEPELELLIAVDLLLEEESLLPLETTGASSPHAVRKTDNAHTADNPNSLFGIKAQLHGCFSHSP